jgi:hypothetical protein
MIIDLPESGVTIDLQRIFTIHEMRLFFHFFEDDITENLVDQQSVIFVKNNITIGQNLA